MPEVQFSASSRNLKLKEAETLADRLLGEVDSIETSVVVHLEDVVIADQITTKVDEEPLKSTGEKTDGRITKVEVTAVVKIEADESSRALDESLKALDEVLRALGESMKALVAVTGTAMAMDGKRYLRIMAEGKVTLHLVLSSILKTHQLESVGGSWKKPCIAMMIDSQYYYLTEKLCCLSLNILWYCQNRQNAA